MLLLLIYKKNECPVIVVAVVVRFLQLMHTDGQTQGYITGIELVHYFAVHPTHMHYAHAFLNTNTHANEYLCSRVTIVSCYTQSLTKIIGAIRNGLHIEYKTGSNIP